MQATVAMSMRKYAAIALSRSRSCFFFFSDGGAAMSFASRMLPSLSSSPFFTSPLMASQL
ncbi:hypothetical protein CCR84_14840 [Rhodocyclus purpureus]|nr:hypothetical protein [Rhodocyclus purpureus]